MVLWCRTCRGFTPIQPDKNARLVQRMLGHTIGPLRLTVGSKIFFFADVHDISILGVGLVADFAFPVGSSFVVEAGRPEGRTLTKALTAELRHATQRADGRWLWGCRFSRYLTVDDIEIIG